MGEIEKTTERGVKTREQLFTKLVEELTIHEKIEEQIFYPAVKERATSKKLEELVAESYEEHHFVDTIKAEIEGTPFEAEEWAAKFKVMMENIEHHAFEEEEGEMFPKVRKAFKKEELDDLGAQMKSSSRVMEGCTRARTGVGAVRARSLSRARRTAARGPKSEQTHPLVGTSRAQRETRRQD